MNVIVNVVGAITNSEEKVTEITILMSIVFVIAICGLIGLHIYPKYFNM